MTAEEALQSDRIQEATELIKVSIRKQPGRVDLRSRLFQLLCIRGDWLAARTQLQLLPELEHRDGDLMLAAPALSSLLDAEEERRDIFAGRKVPVVFGEPPQWLSFHLEGVRALASGDVPAAARLFESGLNAAPTSSGAINGQPFSWIMDVDSRFGPVVEAIIGGRYYWMPFTRIQNVDVAVPEALHERVWLSASFTLANSSILSGYIPVRYPGTETAGDGELLMAKATAWNDLGNGVTLGAGQRFWTTDTADYPILKCRQLEINTTAEVASHA